MTPLPSLPALQAFEAVARLGSFAAAGRELGVSPSAVSHRLRALERELGLSLLERSTRHVALTEAGAALSPAVVSAAQRLREGLRAAEATQRAGPLSVSCSPSFAIRWLVPRLQGFAADHPDIDVRVSASDALADPRLGVDVCLRYGPGGYPGLSALQLSEEEVFPVCSPGLVASLSHPSELRHHVLLEGQALEGHPGRRTWVEWLAAAGAKGVDASRRLRFSHTSLALEAATAGQGVALTRSTLVVDALSRGTLARPFALSLPSGLSYWFVTAPGPSAPRVDAFRRWVVRELAAGEG